VLIEDAVVPEVLRQHQRHALRHTPENDGGAREAQRRILLEPRDELFRALAQPEAHRIHDLLALAPGDHQERHSEGDQQRKPASLEELGRS
jgi:hypothetical protein